MKLKKAHIIVLIAIMSIALISAVLVSTLAIWTESYEDDKTAEIPVGPFNPSEKYIVFVPLDESGNIISDKALAASYAAVGYTGLVGEVEIPPTHQPDGYDEKPVSAVLVDENHADVAFTESVDIITSIIMPASTVRIGEDVFPGFVRIGAGVFSGLENLTSVLIKDTDPPSTEFPNIFVGDYAFAFTLSLTSFEYTGHTFVGSIDSVFYGSAYIPE